MRTLGGRHQQMHMVGHQHVGVDGHLVSLRRHGQIRQIVTIVGIGEETRLPVIAALDDMLGNAGEIESRLTCHEGKARSRSPYPCSCPAASLSGFSTTGGQSSGQLSRL